MHYLVLVTLVVGFSAGALQLQPASAPDPYVEDPDAEWGGVAAPSWHAPDPLVAYALYGQLGTIGDVDVFVYRFEEPVANWPISVLVPVCGQHFTPFYPSIAVIGPGLDSPPPEVLPFNLPAGMGAMILAEADKPTPRPSYMDPHAGQVYDLRRHTLDIPQAGDYIVALWEPDDHVGAYILATGQLERLEGRAEERAAALELIASGAWMGQDCTVPPRIENCPPTRPDALGPFYKPDAPVRNKIGTGGHILTGVVRDSTTCLPIPGAMLEFWQVNEQGNYADTHRATVFANQQGGYRFESNRPQPYASRPAHIHLRISAPGYQTLVTQFYPQGDENEAQFPIALIPE